MAVADSSIWSIPSHWVKNKGRPTTYWNAALTPSGLALEKIAFDITSSSDEFMHAFSSGLFALIWTKPQDGKAATTVYQCNRATGEVMAHATRPVPLITRRYAFARSGAKWLEFDSADRSWRMYREPTNPTCEGHVRNIHSDNPVLSDDGHIIAFFASDYSITFIDSVSGDVISAPGPFPQHWHQGHFSPCGKYFVFHAADPSQRRVMMFAVDVATGLVKNRGYAGIDFGYGRPFLAFLSDASTSSMYFVSDGGHRVMFNTSSAEFSALYVPRLEQYHQPLSWTVNDGILYFADGKRIRGYSPSGALLRSAMYSEGSSATKWEHHSAPSAEEKKWWKWQK